MTTKVDVVDEELKAESSSDPGPFPWRRIVGALSRVSPLAMTLFVLTVATYAFVGHVDGKLGTNDRIQFVKPEATSGDEPHYLVIINSLLFDHDVHIEDDHARIAAGGYEAGARWRGRPFGGHAVLVNQKTGAHALCHQKCDADEIRAVGGDPADMVQVPAHPIAYPMFMALLLSPFRPSPDQVEGLVGEMAILVSIAGVLLVYAIARRSGFGTKAAFASAMLLGFASPWLPYVRSYFSETSIGLFLLLGMLALRRSRPGWAGVAIGIAMAMKSVFVLFGVAWIAERLWAKRYREAFWLAGSTGVCGVVQIGANMMLLRSPVTYGSAPWSSTRGLQSFIDTMAHPTQGLLLFVPWALIPFIWGTIASRPGLESESGQLPIDARRQLILPILLCLGVFSIIGWGPGFCYGPRYWVPLLPFFAPLVVDFVLAGRSWRLSLVSVLAAVSVLIAVPGAIRYRMLFSKPPAAAVFARTGT